MTRLRVAHRLCAVTAIGTGSVILWAAFTDSMSEALTAHWPLFLIWGAATVATSRIYRRMRLTDHNPTLTEEN